MQIHAPAGRNRHIFKSMFTYYITKSVPKTQNNILPSGRHIKTRHAKLRRQRKPLARVGLFRSRTQNAHHHFRQASGGIIVRRIADGVPRLHRRHTLGRRAQGQTQQRGGFIFFQIRFRRAGHVPHQHGAVNAAVPSDGFGSFNHIRLRLQDGISHGDGIAQQPRHNGVLKGGVRVLSFVQGLYQRPKAAPGHLKSLADFQGHNAVGVHQHHFPPASYGSFKFGPDG